MADAPLVVCSPKRTPDSNGGWSGYFPYYAGYPENFAQKLLESAGLEHGASVLDPWNGSGTTTYVASRLGFRAHGVDINPAMVVVARARLLPPSEADSLSPIAREIAKSAASDLSELSTAEPLSTWFGPVAATTIRSVERAIRAHVVGSMTLSATGVHLEKLSGVAATLYVALFALARRSSRRFKSSNPTWTRNPKVGERKVGATEQAVLRQFVLNVESMAGVLSRTPEKKFDPGQVELSVADTASAAPKERNVDFVLTSPPYCTRIDYAAATRIELAVLNPLLGLDGNVLSRSMLGSTSVPTDIPELSSEWGSTCLAFIESVKTHPSKASKTYYYKTHLDYFDKLNRSMRNICKAVKSGGRMVLVVQDSYYKNIYNDLPKIVCEIATSHGMEQIQRTDFRMGRSMSGINPHSRIYARPYGAMESVLSFKNS